MLGKSKTAAFLAGLAAITWLRLVPAPAAQTDDSRMFAAEMRWRPIGPFRGGRTKAITGVATQPNVFYIGAVDADLRRSADRIHRRDCRRALRSEHRLRRQRRRARAAGPVGGRRHLQVDGRGPHLDTPRPA